MDGLRRRKEEEQYVGRSNLSGAVMGRPEGKAGGRGYDSNEGKSKSKGRRECWIRIN